MPYDYKKERDYVFTDEGQAKLFRVLKNVKFACSFAGCCTIEKALVGEFGDSWKNLAVVDRLEELGIIATVPGFCNVTQYRVIFLKSTK